MCGVTACQPSCSGNEAFYMRTRHGVGGNRVISLVSWCILAVAAFLSNEFLPANTTAD